MGSTKLGCVAASLISLCVCAPSAMAGRVFKPRIGGAMGLIPARGDQEIALGSGIPVVYHGGSVMRGVRIHTLFWAPSGYGFDGSPAAGVLSYEQLIQQFFTDVAHDSGSTANVFSVLGEYPDHGGPGGYGISYSASADSIDVTAPYPPAGRQCASPSGIGTCVTDLELQQEIEKVIRAHDPAGRGLHDVWFVFLPPNVDTCVSSGQCGTNTFAGYHSLSNFGAGATIYANIPDPLIEGTPAFGSDPQGNPEAELAIDVAAHELVEAITDPEGVAWMDPNGFEVGDKCENGSQPGKPIGNAVNGAPYNQLINGDRYLLQTMWSNKASGCAQSSTSTSSALPLASVNLSQFSPSLSGNIGTPTAGIAVSVQLARAGTLVGTASGVTGRGGAWGPVTLRSVRGGALRGVGDDREEILVRYGARGPAPDLIETGNGGNPFLQAGWTGWLALDTGYAVGSSAVAVAPCSQTGVLGVVVDGRPTAPPIERCETESDVAAVTTTRLRPGTLLSMSSEDNRAVTIFNPAGALVKLTIPLGEPGSVADLGNAQTLLQPTGFPSCTADLRSQAVRCTGLVPGARYVLTRRRRHAVKRATADGSGAASFRQFAGSPGISGGDLMTLRNHAGRTLTTLHVAHLRVDLNGEETVLASGRCEPGDYYGPPLDAPPVSAGIGTGVAGTGTICPLSGTASGLPVASILQVDELSGGQTRTEVPELESTAPVQDATLYGPFTALAQTALPGANGSSTPAGARVALTISRASSRRVVFRAANVGTAGGVTVSNLPRGRYLAKWVVIDANGDTRTVHTQFVQEQ